MAYFLTSLIRLILDWTNFLEFNKVFKYSMLEKLENGRISQRRTKLAWPACQNTGAAAMANGLGKQLTNQAFWSCERWMNSQCAFLRHSNVNLPFRSWHLSLVPHFVSPMTIIKMVDNLKSCVNEIQHITD